MRILFAISLIALAALLWASVSIAQHIYRARLRQREKNRRPVTTIGATPIKPAGKETGRQRKAS
jgi:hypothetical protein